MSDDGDSIAEQQELKRKNGSDGEIANASQQPGDSQTNPADRLVSTLGINQSWVPSVPRLQIDSAQQSKDPDVFANG